MGLIHVSVTKEDIMFSDGRRPRKCMCYRAIKRLLPNHDFSVDVDDVYFLENEGFSFTSVPLPADVARRVELHASGEYKGGPFEFDWEIPDTVLNRKAGD